MPNDRINILHVTDLHLDHTARYETSVVLDALHESIKSLAETHYRPHLIVFTGDVIKRGEDLDSYDAAINVFSNIVECANLPPEKLVFIPGNHDADRTAIQGVLESHIKHRTELNIREKLNLAFENDGLGQFASNFSKYKTFEGLWDSAPVLKSNKIYRVLNFDDLGLNIVAINTALTTTAGLRGEKDDYRKLLFPEQALDEALASCQSTLKNIVIGHHPTEWLAPGCRTDIEALLQSKADAYLSGHLHEGVHSSVLSPLGECFYNQSGALFTYRRDRFISYSIIALSRTAPHFEAQIKSYIDYGRKFINCNVVGEDGVFFSSKEAKAFWLKHPERIDEKSWDAWLQSDVKMTISELFKDSLYDKSLTDVFVEPTLSKFANRRGVRFPQYRQSLVSSKDIVTDENNYMIASKREFGRTTYLKFLADKSLSETRKLPIYASFDDIRLGHNAVERALRMSLPETFSSGMTLQRALGLGRCILIFDDINPEKMKEFEALKAFMIDYPKNKFILSTNEDNQEIISQGWITPEIPINSVLLHILPFNRYQMRQLVRAWAKYDDLGTDRLLTRIMSDIIRINVPITPVNGSIFLSIMDRHPQFEPINRSVIVTQFIELLLGKFNAFDAFRSTFDFENKRHVLSFLAQQMVMRSRSVFSTTETLDIIKKFMSDYDFDFDAEKVLDQFIKGRILSHRESEVEFRYKSFFEYSVAAAMDMDSTFRDYILAPERYLQFGDEIEFYSGIRRTDNALVDLLAARLDEITNGLTKENQWDCDLDLFEKLDVRKQQTEELAQSVEASLKAPPLSDKQRDELLEKQFPSNVGQNQKVHREEFAHDGARLLQCLKTYCRVTRNAEGILAPSKRAAVYRALLNWAKFCAHSLANAKEIAEKRTVLINGVRYIVRFGEELPNEELLQQLYYAFPTSVAEAIRVNLGSEKLKMTLSRTLSDDGQEPRIVTFFRLALYSDLKLDEYEDKLALLSKQLSNADYLRQCLLRRVRFLFRISLQSEQSRLRPVLTQLLRSTLQGTGSQKTNVITEEIRSLEQDSLLMRSFLTETGEPTAIEQKDTK